MFHLACRRLSYSPAPDRATEYVEWNCCTHHIRNCAAQIPTPQTDIKSIFNESNAVHFASDIQSPNGSHFVVHIQHQCDNFFVYFLNTSSLAHCTCKLDIRKISSTQWYLSAFCTLLNRYPASLQHNVQLISSPFQYFVLSNSASFHHIGEDIIWLHFSTALSQHTNYTVDIQHHVKTISCPTLGVSEVSRKNKKGGCYHPRW